MKTIWNMNKSTNAQLCVGAVVRVPDAECLLSMTYLAKDFVIDTHDPGGSDG